MAVLTFPEADAVLVAQAAALPQPDQLCGPFAVRAALHAVLDPAEVPTLAELARASGSAIWPRDVPAWRPVGAPCDRSSWTNLAAAPSTEFSGTNAAGLAGGVAAATHASVVAVPVAGAEAGAEALAGLFASIARSDLPVGVVANVNTGALDPTAGWDVGHFVVLWAIDIGHLDDALVAVADSYRELGAPGEPPGCRWVTLTRLADAIAAPPGRGLLLLVRPASAPVVTVMVTASGLRSTIWST
jgi:hypothetical protein